MSNTPTHKPARAGATPGGASRPSPNRNQQPQNRPHGTQHRPQGAPKRPPQRRPAQNDVFVITPKMIVVATSVILALMVLILGVIVIAKKTSGKDIFNKNITYVAFEK